MNETILIKKDSYINVSIQKNESNDHIDINIKVEPVIEFKDGDILTRKEKDDKLIFIFKDVASDGSLGYYCYYHLKWNKRIYTLGYGIATVDDILNKKVKHATLEDLDEFFRVLQEDGKNWNRDKKCIEDIYQHKFKRGDKVILAKDKILLKGPVFKDEDDFNKAIVTLIDTDKVFTVSGYNKFGLVTIQEESYIIPEKFLEFYEEEQHKFKFKPGDKVKIKDGISNHTHYWEFPGFTKEKDAYIGKVLTVYGYDRFLQVEVDECDYTFSENWLELVSDELKVGDWVIAWSVVGEEVIAKLENIYGSNNKYKVAHTWYQNAVKWDGTKEQLEKLRKS